MTTMLKFDTPEEQAPIIKVIGVGGGRAGQPAVSTDQLVVAAVAMLHPVVGATAA